MNTMNHSRSTTSRRLVIFSSIIAIAAIAIWQSGCSAGNTGGPPSTNQALPSQSVPSQSVPNAPSATSSVQPNDDPRGLKKSAKATIESLCAGNYNRVLGEFNERMKQAVSPEKLKSDWIAVTARFGICSGQGAPMTSLSPDGLDTITIRSKMDHGAIDIDVVYDREGKISGLWMRPVQ